MIYLILAMLFYSAATIIIAVASRNLNTNAVTGIINTISAIIPFTILLVTANKNSILNQKYGLTMAIVAGVLISFFSLALTKSYSMNKVAIVAPTIFGGAIFLSAILSYFLFKEKISLVQGIGLIFLFVGLVLIIYARATGR